MFLMKKIILLHPNPLWWAGPPGKPSTARITGHRGTLGEACSTSRALNVPSEGTGAREGAGSSSRALLVGGCSWGVCLAAQLLSPWTFAAGFV